MSEPAVTQPVTTLLAPSGVLRACINTGNAVLARRDAEDQPPYGVSVDLAAALAERLGVPLECLVVTSARQSVAAVTEGRADVGFFAVDPARGETIAFTEPYLDIEGWYAVREDSPIVTNAQVDRPGITVGVSNGSAYDLFLSRELQHAEIVRCANPQAVTPTVLAEGLDVSSGVRQQLELDMAANPGLRLLPERFMVIHQAMGVARSRGPEAAAALAAFVEGARSSGVVAEALARNGVSA